MGLLFGDVIVVPFPFTDQTAVKKRPAVVISSEAYQRERADIILMAITSQVRAAPTVGEVAVVHWQAAGLLKPSVIKPLITTIEAGLVSASSAPCTPTISSRSAWSLRQFSGSGDRLPAGSATLRR
jgi:mRNA interferase MazF